MTPDNQMKYESYTLSQDSLNHALILPVDINSNNFFSCVVIVQDGLATNYMYPKDETAENMLTGFINSWGVIEKNHYLKLNTYGFPTGRTACTLSADTFQYHNYNFDVLKRNLSSRKDNIRNLQENFTYDNLNRLKTFGSFNMEYDAKGNILENYHLSPSGSNEKYDNVSSV